MSELKDTLTQTRLKELLHYDPETGIFINKISRGGQKVGAVSGGIMPGYCGGYIRIRLDQRRYLAHRLAWLYMTGNLPEKQIDHINHVRGDNRFSNLRESTQAENTRNASMCHLNKSGKTGVYFHKKNMKWAAQIGHGSNKEYLGSFDYKHEAISARKQAELKRGYHPNHGE